MQRSRNARFLFVSILISYTVGHFLEPPSVHARERKVLQKTQAGSQAGASDFYVAESTPGVNFGASTSLRVRGGRGPLHERSVVLFDFADVSNVGIKKATLTLQILEPPAQDLVLSAHRVTSFSGEGDASWTERIANLTWKSPGADFIGQPTALAAVGPSSLSASWDITADVRSWFGGSANYGTMIRVLRENNLAPRTTFASKEWGTPDQRPSLDLVFVQNVHEFHAVPGDARVSLSWSYPSAIGEVLEANVGVVVLRRSGRPVDASAMPSDGTDPGLCTTLGSATVVFDDFAGATSFVDDSSSPCGGPTNDTTWYYKIFVRDSANLYSSNNPSDSAFTPETVATPSSGSPQAPLWINGTHSALVAAPSLSPGNTVIVGSRSNLLFKFQPQSGARSYFPVSLGASVGARSSLIDAQDSSLGSSTLYVVDSSGLAYAVDTESGDFTWITNPTQSITTRFGAAGAVWVKSFGGVGYFRDTDLFIAGTRNVDKPRGNEIVAIDGNTGHTVWRTVGGVGKTPGLDIVNSTPWIDYSHNAIWVTSRSAGAAQPSLWKLDPNTGAILSSVNLRDIDSSPTMTPQAELLVVGNNDGTLYAIDPMNGQVLASYQTADGPIRGYPLVANFTPPFQIVVSGSSKVQMVTFDLRTHTFTPNWSTKILRPSAPIGFADIGRVYVGSADGKLHELVLATGNDTNQRVVNPVESVTVGDPSLDVVLSRIYVSASDGRVYAFSYPF